MNFGWVPRAVARSSPPKREKAWSRSSGSGSKGAPFPRCSQRHCLLCRSQSWIHRSNRRARRSACSSIRASPARWRFQRSPVETDLGRPREARGTGPAGHRELLDRARLPAEGLSELAQDGVVGHEHVPRVRVENARRLGQRGNDEADARVVRGRRVLEELRRHRVRPLGGQDARRVLVARAERVASPVGALHGEADALHRADLPDGSEPARERLEVEDLEIDRRDPQLPVSGAHEEIVEGGGVVAGTAGHHVPVLGGAPGRSAVGDGQADGGRGRGAPQ